MVRLGPYVVKAVPQVRQRLILHQVAFFPRPLTRGLRRSCRCFNVGGEDERVQTRGQAPGHEAYSHGYLLRRYQQGEHRQGDGHGRTTPYQS